MRFIMMRIVRTDQKSAPRSVAEEHEPIGLDAYNDELVKVGVMLAGEGLHAERHRVRFEGTERTVRSGSLVESNEMVCGFWLLQVKSQAEALAWLERAPFRDGELELRQIFEAA